VIKVGIVGCNIEFKCGSLTKSGINIASIIIYLESRCTTDPVYLPIHTGINFFLKVHNPSLAFKKKNNHENEKNICAAYCSANTGSNSLH
jgi:hypothetical protein